jgi:hypothetical protein
MQGFLSVLLAFELPIWTVNFKVVRLMSLWAAVMFNISYFWMVFEWWEMLYLVGDKSSYDFITVFLNCLLGYNIVMHWSIIPINNFIIAKEISMEFFQFLRLDAGYSTDSVSLGLADFLYLIQDFLWFWNPLTWVDLLWEGIFGYDVEDYFYENDEDPEVYYVNWW